MSSSAEHSIRGSVLRLLLLPTTRHMTRTHARVASCDGPNGFKDGGDQTLRWQCAESSSRSVAMAGTDQVPGACSRHDGSGAQRAKAADGPRLRRAALSGSHGATAGLRLCTTGPPGHLVFGIRVGCSPRGASYDECRGPDPPSTLLCCLSSCVGTLLNNQGRPELSGSGFRMKRETSPRAPRRATR